MVRAEHRVCSLVGQPCTWALRAFQPSLRPPWPAILIGGVTLTGSLIAYGKLSERINSAPWTFAGQRVFNALLLAAIVASGVLFAMDPAADSQYLYALIALALVLGVMASFLSAVPTCRLSSPCSIVTGPCGLCCWFRGPKQRADRRRVTGRSVWHHFDQHHVQGNEPFSRECALQRFRLTQAAKAVEGEVKPISVEDAYYILEAASNVCFVPGYGMAVAQAQHMIKNSERFLNAAGVKSRTNSPGCRQNARPHERTACGSRCAL